MSKITLGKPPKAFKPVAVTFAMPDGTQGRIECTFRYRTRREFGALLEKHRMQIPESAELHAYEKNADAAVQNAGAYLLDALSAWDLDIELNEANAAQLADELPAAARAIYAAYTGAVTEGHLGN